jgi:hypothetical protein
MQLPHLLKYKNDLRLYAATVLRLKALEQWFRSPLPGFWRDQLATERLDLQGRFQLAGTAHLIDEHVAGLAIHTWRLLAMLTTTVWQDAVLRGGA